jgi:hypothetical protein
VSERVCQKEPTCQKETVISFSSEERKLLSRVVEEFLEVSAGRIC